MRLKDLGDLIKACSDFERSKELLIRFEYDPCKETAEVHLLTDKEHPYDYLATFSVSNQFELDKVIDILNRLNYKKEYV